MSLNLVLKSCLIADWRIHRNVQSGGRFPWTTEAVQVWDDGAVDWGKRVDETQ